MFPLWRKRRPRLPQTLHEMKPRDYLLSPLYLVVAIVWLIAMWLDTQKKLKHS